MNKNLLIVLAIVVLLVVAGGAFYGGMVYGKGQATTSASAFRAEFSGRNRNGANGAGFVSGSIISKDATSITLQLPNNSGSKIIFYSPTTQINKFAQGTADDLKTGANVSVTGTTNSDGTLTAKSIQVK